MSDKCPMCGGEVERRLCVCESCGDCFNPCQGFKDTCRDYANTVKERDALKVEVEELRGIKIEKEEGLTIGATVDIIKDNHRLKARVQELEAIVSVYEPRPHREDSHE